jgi:hypothetical protein
LLPECTDGLALKNVEKEIDEEPNGASAGHNIVPSLESLRYSKKNMIECEDAELDGSDSKAEEKIDHVKHLIP